jgi:hypothetical protein
MDSHSVGCSWHWLACLRNGHSQCRYTPLISGHPFRGNGFGFRLPSRCPGSCSAAHVCFQTVGSYSRPEAPNGVNTP